MTLLSRYKSPEGRPEKFGGNELSTTKIQRPLYSLGLTPKRTLNVQATCQKKKINRKPINRRNVTLDTKNKQI